MTKQNIFDVNDINAAAKLAQHYRKYSYGGTTQYKFRKNENYVYEFHPMWGTFQVKSGRCILKVSIKCFQFDTGWPDGTDHIWFNVIVTKNYIEAVCQLDKGLRFLIMGKNAALEAKQLVDDEELKIA